MLYLAEVLKQSKGFMGGFETKLRLLASQRNDQSWNALSNQEIVAAEEVSNFAEGALVIVKLGGNRQIQGTPEAAAGRVLSILQSFSRLMEKSKQQEEEIEQWKESLTIQSEELSRREIEMEANLEALEEKEQELERLEQEREEINRLKEETAKLKEEFERKSQELEGAWQHLRGEQQTLESLQNEAHLSKEQAERINTLMESLFSASESVETVREKFNLAQEALHAQQSCLDNCWRELEQHKQQIPQEQIALEQEKEKLSNCRQELDDIQASYQQNQAQLGFQQEILASKNKLVAMFDSFYQEKEGLRERIALLGIESGDFNLEQKVDIDALEKMPLGDLQRIVEDLQKDLEKMVRFVNEQEEELTLQCRAVEEIQQKLNTASQYDRLTLEQELAEEREARSMLDETLVGQRRQLRERQEYFLQHLRIFRRRQGVIDFENTDRPINLEPIVLQLEEQKRNIQLKKRELEQEIAQINDKIAQIQAQIEQQGAQQETKKQELQQQEHNWQQATMALAAIQSEVKIAETTLQPLQNSFSAMREKMENLAQLLAQMDENSHLQKAAIAEVKEVCSGLGKTPAMAGT